MRIKKFSFKLIAITVAAGMLITSVPEAVLRVSAETIVDISEDDAETDGDTEADSNAETDGDTEADSDSETGSESTDDNSGDSYVEAREEESEPVSEEDTEDTESDEENTESDEENTESDEENAEEIVSETEEADELTVNDGNLFAEKTLDGYRITIYAEKDIFPEGTQVCITRAENSRILEIEDDIQVETELGFYVEEIAVFDISFSFEGKEIQPEGGQVAVVISVDDRMEEAAEKDESELKVYHVDEADALEEKTIVDAEDILPEELPENIDYEKEDVAFETDSFSEYALVVITESMEEEADFGYYLPEEEDSIDYTYHENFSENAIAMLGASYQDSSYVTPNLPGLKNQNPYGTCWAHSAMALGEINLMNNTGDTSERDFSELHLAYFSYNTVEDPLGGTQGDKTLYSGDPSNLLDRGGNLVYAGRTLASWQGAIAEEKAPYNSEYQSKANGSGLDSSLAYDDVAHLTDFYQIDVSDPSNIDEAKKLILDTGAVGVSIYAYTSEYSAKAANAYSVANNAYYVSSPKGKNGARGTNHAVTLVGWDDNFSAGNFLTNPGYDGAWLVRNSWTTVGEGEDGYYGYYGYFWISYYDANISKGTSYVFDSADNYDNNYQYDGNVCSGFYTVNTSANVFKVKANEGGEFLEAASFNTLSQNATYTIDIYTGLTDANSPDSGTKVASESGAFKYSGYYTVPLSSPVPLSYGEVFSVVVTITDNNNEGKIGVEYANNDTANNVNYMASASAGQSFYKKDNIWYDVSEKKGLNLRIKAFTTNRTYVSLENNIATNGVKLSRNTTFTPTWRVLPEDAANKSVLWSSSNSDVAIVNENGTVTAVTYGTAVITATSVESGVAVSYTVTVPKEYYTINYVLNGGVNNSQNPSFYTTKTSTVKLKNPTRTGYTFAGWYTSNKYKKKVTSISKGSAGDKTLYAKWVANKYKVKYSAGGGEGTMDVQSCTYGKAFTLKKNTFTRKGYRFVGWATTKNGPVVYKNKQRITNSFTAKKNGKITLYAKWEIEKYNIKYSLRGGVNNSSNPQQYTVKSSFKLKNPTRDGYVFKGWYSDPQCENRVKKIGKGNTGRMTLYAKWEKK